MSGETKACIYSIDPGFSRILRERLASVAGVKVITEAGDRSTLLDALRRLNIDALVVNLDPQPQAVLETIDGISTANPGLAIVGISENSSSEMIIAAMRAGCRQFVAKPLEAADLSQAMARLSIHRTAADGPGKRFSVIGASGGAGTTSIACNLAIELGRIANQHVALVDLHLEFGDVCTSFDSDPPNTIADLCDPGTELDEELVKAAVTELPCRVALLGRPKHVEQAAGVVPEQVGRCMHLLGSMYPAVVVDTPRSFDRLTLATLEQADAVLIVLQLNVPSIRNAIRCHRTLTSYGMPPDRVHIVVNRYREKQDAITPKDVESQLGQTIFALVPNDYQVVSSALNYGHSLAADAPDSPVHAAIAQMARRLLSPGDAAVGIKRPGSTGIFSRIFGAS